MVTTNELLMKIDANTDAQKDVAKSLNSNLEKLNDNLKQLNDSNILHHTAFNTEIKSIKEKVLLLTNKHFWLIVFLISAMLVIMGYKEAVGNLI
jgi:hypothetical protein